MAGAFLHLRDTWNLGDRWCSPFDWFDWPEDAFAADIRKPVAAYDWAVLGGGKIFGGVSTYPGVNQDLRGRHIAWGVSTVQMFPFSLRYARARRLCRLVGSRDYGDRDYPWAPCPSCMSPEFDAPAAPEHDLVFYAHAGKTGKQGLSIPDSIPVLTNAATALPEALRFIASGRTVVTNSYHGTYWALLMGRNVLCIPFSGKFARFRLPPAYATPKNWLSRRHTAQAQPEMLALCRARTREFKDQVVAEINLMKGGRT